MAGRFRKIIRRRSSGINFSKRVEEARQAHARNDLDLSREAHDPRRIAKAAEERHGGESSQYLGEMVYGGLEMLLVGALAAGAAYTVGSLLSALGGG